MTEDSNNPGAPASLYFAASFVLDSEGIYMVEDDIARVLDLNFEARRDLEIGSAEDEGAYFRFQPAATAVAGLDHVRLRGLDAAPPGWPCRARAQELSIGILGTDLLEVGRVAAVLERLDWISPVTHGVGPLRFGAGHQEFWRAHKVGFSSRESASTAWRAALADGRPTARDGLPMLQCQLVFGYATHDMAEAGALTESLFGCPLHGYQLYDLDGPFLRHAGVDPGGQEWASLLIRPNAVGRDNCLYADRREHSLLLDVNLRTPNLLELGRIAASVEAGHGDAMQVVAYRVCGDLLRDGVPRMLSRRFPNAADAASTWHLGHSYVEEVDVEDEPSASMTSNE